jgi:LacI family transcriptional regulator, fructose operon transcriptional repressor
LMDSTDTRKKTIYDVAEATGASASTVSAVLNGSWQARRIKEETANGILEVAKRIGYSTNLQARGLRNSRSGLAGMIIPMHHNRYFGTLSHEFELEARKRNLCPVIVSTSRNPAEEQRTVEQLVSFNVESIMITGATAPDAISRICSRAGIRHVNVDLPGTRAPSVISDNYWGAAELTHVMVKRLVDSGEKKPGPFYFIGGVHFDHNTKARIAGFTDKHHEILGGLPELNIRANGYDADVAELQIRALYAELGELPHGLFVNSTIAFEGVVRFLKSLPHAAFDSCVVGCYDWDPFAEFLSFPVVMARQKTELLITEAFRLLDHPPKNANLLIEVKPELIEY